MKISKRSKSGTTTRTISNSTWCLRTFLDLIFEGHARTDVAFEYRCTNGKYQLCVSVLLCHVSLSLMDRGGGAVFQIYYIGLRYGDITTDGYPEFGSVLHLFFTLSTALTSFPSVYFAASHIKVLAKVIYKSNSAR